MKAIYEVNSTPKAAQYHVWTGRVECLDHRHSQVWKTKYIEIGGNGRRCMAEHAVRAAAKWLAECVSCGLRRPTHRKAGRVERACWRCCHRHNGGKFSERYLVTYRSLREIECSSLTVQDVADLTGLSVETLNQWRSRNMHIPWIKIGRTVRYLRKDVEAYLQKCRVVPPGSEEAR